MDCGRELTREEIKILEKYFRGLTREELEEVVSLMEKQGEVE